MALNQGQVLQNRYRIAGLIEQGGFGAIYRAWDTVLARGCALKENLDASPEAGRQFEREAKILAGLSHPNLPRVTDHFFIPGQGQYLVMDLVDGQDLQSMLEARGGPLSEREVLPWTEQVCDALAYLHAQQPPIIHRDIKPANIQITPQGKAMLVDFGIAKVYDLGMKTTIGARAVTPGFSPYEQYGHDSTDERSDIYALGATLYTLLCGQEPPESVQRVVRDPLIKPERLNPLISHQTSAAIMRAMQMDPVLRFQSASQFKAGLHQVPKSSAGVGTKTAHPSTKMLPWAQIGAAGLILLLFVLIVMSVNNQPEGKSATYVPTSLAVGTATTPAISTTTATSTNSAPFPTQVPESDAPKSTPLVYIVQPGDTCSKIAQQYGVSTANIIAQNHLDTNCSILAGSRLLIVDSIQTPEPSKTLTQTAMLDTWPAEATKISPVDGMEMVYIPAGAFLMGASMDEPFATNTEKPQSWVFLDAYWIDRTEVTNAMYARCVAADICPPASQTRSKTRFGYFNDPAYANYPVIYVSWHNARTYCAWAGRRLPSEAEWEKAARGVDGRLYPWGEERPSSTLSNFDNKIGDTTPVGSFGEGASPYGTLDMAGNVREWVADWYAENYYAIMPVINPFGPVDGEFRILRGGSWFSSEASVRAAARLWNYPELVSDSNGFRCAGTP